MLLRGHSCLGRLDPPPGRSAWCEMYSPRRLGGLPAAHCKRATLVPSAALRRGCVCNFWSWRNWPAPSLRGISADTQQCAHKDGSGGPLLIRTAFREVQYENSYTKLMMSRIR